MDQNEKVRENRLRRTAGRQGLNLMKSRRRDPRALEYGGYMLKDAFRNIIVAGASPHEYSWTLDDVEDYLMGTPTREA